MSLWVSTVVVTAVVGVGRVGRVTVLLVVSVICADAFFGIDGN